MTGALRNTEPEREGSPGLHDKQGREDITKTSVTPQALRVRARNGAPGKIRAAVAAAAGTCVENYDFLAYGTASALYFGHDFFPQNDPTVGTLLAFATFGVGFLVRPLGGVIGGYFADKYGRKPVLLFALMVMGIATTAVGLLPTYQTVGIWAPILLVAIRVIQGLAFGAEWSGAVLMAYEHAPWRRRGLFAAVPLAGNPLGIGLASVVFLLSSSLPGELAWRVPFLGSVVLIGIGVIVRTRIGESPEFLEMKEGGELDGNPLATVIREDWRLILRVIAIRMVESCGYYVTSTYLLTYVTEHHLAERTVALRGHILGCIVAIGTVIAFGALSDRVGRKPVYIGACVGTLLLAIGAFLLVGTGDPVFVMLAFVLAIGVVWAAFAGVQGAWFAELFASRVRASGASLGYQCSASLAGFSPFLATLLAARYGWHGPAAFLVCIGVAGLIGVGMTRETWGRVRRLETQAFIRGGPVPVGEPMATVRGAKTVAIENDIPPLGID